jgi:hypothetical protein
MEDGTKLEDTDVLTANIWNSFNFQENLGNGEIKTWEPKFSNSVDTLNLRPNVGKDEVIENLYHASGYTRTTSNIFNMESASEGGCRVAKMIEENLNKNSNKVNLYYDRDDPSLFCRVIQKIDEILYKCRLPHVVVSSSVIVSIIGLGIGLSKLF